MTALQTEVGAHSPAGNVPFAPSANIPQTDVQRAIESVRAYVTTAVAGLLNIQGNWDASAGTFPGSGTAAKGALYRVSVAGTVDSVSFSVGDAIYALVDNASTTTFLASWNKAEGIITEAEIALALGFTFSANAKTFNAAANYAAMTALLSVFSPDNGVVVGLKGMVPAPSIGDLAAGRVLGVGGWSDAGAGNVVGPASAINNSIAVFDLSTGKLIKDGGTTIAGLTASILATVRDGVSGAFDTLAEIATDLGLKMVKSANLSDVANAATAYANILQKSAAAAFLAATSENKSLVAENVWTAAAPVTITFAAAQTLDMSTFINGIITLTANMTSLAAPTNAKPGQSGVILLKQDGTGSRTWASLNAVYKWPGATAGVLSTTASRVDKLFYFVETTSLIHLSLEKDSR